MTTPVTNSDLRAVLSGLVKQLIIWGPIVVGIVHQVLMYFSTTNERDGIYVFLDPPGYIYPFTSLEAAWWIVLTLITSILCFLTSIDRLRPHRLVYPFYAYLLFLLIFVKPV